MNAICIRTELKAGCQALRFVVCDGNFESDASKFVLSRPKLQNPKHIAKKNQVFFEEELGSFEELCFQSNCY